MTSQTQSAVAALRNITPKLNKVTDSANAAVREAERVLAEIGVGLPAEVQFDAGDYRGGDEDGYSVRCRLLSFERVSGKFRICIVDETRSGSALEHDRFGDTVLTGEAVTSRQVFLWDQANRETRLEAVTVLGQLIEELAGKAQQVSERAEAAIQPATDILDSLRERQ